MKILAIETATLMGGVALTSDEGLLAEYRLDVRTTHSEQLMVAVDRVLKSSHTPLQEIDAFAISIGPGSFTGLRIGLSTVKAFALVTGRPVLPVSTLEAMANSLPFTTHPICPLLDAKRGEVYTALFTFIGTNKLQRLREDQVIAPLDLAQQITQPTILLGNGLNRYGDQLRQSLGEKAILAPKHLWSPSALQVAELAREQWREGHLPAPSSIVPHYLRRSEAEVKWERRPGTTALNLKGEKL
jgi:tRNA threonylcarbamoyladenosine biosynthesis protein TsaB